MSTLAKVSIIIPAHNEAENIGPISKKLIETLEKLPYRYEILFIDDGSEDDTLAQLQKLNQHYPQIHYIELSRNFGHQNALKAGFDLADGDCVICMDADLQHPPELIEQFLQKWEEGYEIVYSKRQDAEHTSKFKKRTSKLFYWLLNKLSEVQIEEGTADFRLIDRKVADIFQNFSEYDPFVRGLVKWTGFKKFGIEYYPNERHAGETKYTTSKMLRFAIHGLTSFSVKPLNAAIYIGLGFSSIALLYIPYVFYSIYQGEVVLGWASLIMTITFFSGIQIMILGIIGIYIGKIFMQSKKRPNYIIRNTTYTK
jgi:dolichol-phosphate mannosyltransferase